MHTQIILIRHGQAEAYQADDAGRNLTARGIQQAHWTAQAVLAEYTPDLLVTSPYRRAEQTMAAFLEQCPELKVLVSDALTPDANPRVAIDILATLPSQYRAKCVVVVCHMNIIAEIAGLLIDEEPEGFSLAEARVFEQSLVLLGLSVERARFVPPANLD